MIASCAHVLLDFGVPNVRAILWIQTYCTRFIDNLLLNELLSLSCKYAVASDDVASIVNFARADQSFVDVCFPTLESHSKTVLSRSLYAQASTKGNEFGATVIRPRFRANPCIQRKCRNRCTCVIGPSQPTIVIWVR